MTQEDTRNQENTFEDLSHKERIKRAKMIKQFINFKALLQNRDQLSVAEELLEESLRRRGIKD
jgi:hypothetical protein